MREIKFRAWHEGANEYPKVNKASDCLRWLEEGQPVIIEQYTGLKDMNGVEIYEGDIIAKPGWHYPISMTVEFGFHSDHSSYMFQLGWNLWEDEGYQVVGNIHENPELLEASHEEDN